MPFTCRCISGMYADEAPVAMLKPGAGKTHRAYLWSYCGAEFVKVRSIAST